MIKESFQYIKRTLTKPRGLDIDSVHPVSEWFGGDRGTPVDRYYIEKFLEENSDLIRGNVLEVASNKYIKRFGKNVASMNVLHPIEGTPGATIIGDLTDPDSLPENKFQCFICTQTFHVIYNYMDAIRGAHKLLKPGGVLLATLGAIAQISKFDMERWGDYWRFTTRSAQLSFQQIFGEENIEINYYGNCLAATSLLRGIAAEELPRSKLDIRQPEYPVIITVVAKKV
jgi:SAM-dependent methyltransferase